MLKFSGVVGIGLRPCSIQKILKSRKSDLYAFSVLSALELLTLLNVSISNSFNFVVKSFIYSDNH